MNRAWKTPGIRVGLATLLAAFVISAEAAAQDSPSYATYGTFTELMAGAGARYPKLVRVSDPGTSDSPNYTGFFFYQCQQFDPAGRYMLGMRVHCQNRDVRPMAFSITAGGTDVRFLYDRPSHHEWQDDRTILDGRGYDFFQDDGTGKAKGRPLESSHNGHVSSIPGPGGDWIVSDTYAVKGYQYLFLYHRPSGRFVPLAKLKSTAPEGIYRADLHPRLSRNARMLSIDATHEGVGRQMYLLDIGQILDHPPVGRRNKKEVGSL